MAIIKYKDKDIAAKGFEVFLRKCLEKEKVLGRQLTKEETKEIYLDAIATTKSIKSRLTPLSAHILTLLAMAGAMIGMLFLLDYLKGITTINELLCRWEIFKC